MTDQRADDRAPLRTRASAIEIVAADHPAWEISRDRDGAAHGHWRATRGDATVSAPTTPELLDALEAHELDRLRAEHVDRWRVWRTPGTGWPAPSSPGSSRPSWRRAPAPHPQPGHVGTAVPEGHAVTLAEFVRLTAARTTRDPAPATTGGSLPRRRSRTAPTVPAPRGEHRDQPQPRL
ncbi:hypothetical protein ACFQBR_33455 [Nocardiopsis tropica]|uniref:hypothetical protein n=1 Tax=Nocardiopsis tropica TaxID=109330 RepID=UPI0031D00873